MTSGPQLTNSLLRRARPPVGGTFHFENLIRAGLKRAVAQGVKLGRPKIDGATERKVRRLLAKGVGILKVAKSLGTGTVQRISGERVCEGRSNEQERAAPSPKAVPSKVICDALAPPVGGIFLLEISVMPPLPKTCPKMVSSPRRG
jgi:hypothetical protein